MTSVPVVMIRQPQKHDPCADLGLPLRGKKEKGFVTPTETNVHGDALCFMGKTWARHKTTEAVLNNVWRFAAVGGCWRLAVGGS